MMDKPELLTVMSDINWRMDSVRRILSMAAPDHAEPLDSDALLSGAHALIEEAEKLLLGAMTKLRDEDTAPKIDEQEHKG